MELKRPHFNLKEDVWSKIWKCHIHVRHKLLLSRIVSNVMPMKGRLARIGHGLNEGCSAYGAYQ